MSTALSDFLKANNARFLEDVAKDGGKSWTIVMGNEAGDLDSVASAIGYSYLNHKKSPTVALIQTPRPDVILPLRAENLLALTAANISSTHGDLLCIDDLPVAPSKLSTTFALVDHNSLLPLWQDRPADAPEAKVVGIIDHHDDEKHHLDASPRAIHTPLGSCASLVAKVFSDAWLDPTSPDAPPRELAGLLLSAIYIDTGGLKPKGKATQIDRESALMLEHVFHPDSSFTDDNPPEARESWSEELSTKKETVDHLSSHDLLRRDFKEFVFNTPEGKRVTVGLSTVPVGLKPWLEKDADGFRASLERWASERALDVVGVLTSFRTANKGKHRREMLLLIGAGGATSAEGAEEDRAALVTRLTEGLEAKEVLELEAEKLKHEFAPIKEGGDKGIVKLWKQGNAKATRKIVAPAFREILEGKKAD